MCLSTERFNRFCTPWSCHSHTNALQQSCHVSPEPTIHHEEQEDTSEDEDKERESTKTSNITGRSWETRTQPMHLPYCWDVLGLGNKQADELYPTYGSTIEGYSRSVALLSYHAFPQGVLCCCEGQQRRQCTLGYIIIIIILVWPSICMGRLPAKFGSNPWILSKCRANSHYLGLFSGHCIAHCYIVWDWWIPRFSWTKSNICSTKIW
jgi:hypothetical protein